MDNTIYVPFEPGSGSKTVFTPRRAAARVVEKVPEAAEIRSPEAEAWFGKPAIQNLRCVRTGRAADAPTRVAIFYDGKCLFFAFDCYEPDIERAHRLVPADSEDGRVEILTRSRSIDYDESIVVMLDCAHSMRRFYGLQVNINGARNCFHSAPSMTWAVFPRHEAVETEKLSWESDVAEGASRWRAAIKADLSSICRDAVLPPAIGLELLRLRNVECWQAYSWGETIHQSYPDAYGFGDLYLNSSDAFITRIDWGERAYGANKMKISLSGYTKRSVLLRVKTYDSDGPEGADYAVESASEPAEIEKGRAALEADYYLPFNHHSMNVAVNVSDFATGESLYHAQYPLHDHTNLRICKPRKRALRECPGNPMPSDGEFYRRKVEWLLSKIPGFFRQTTAAGAPGDFTLTAWDGSIMFNLMEPGVLQKIAGWISSLFEEDDDRLAAVSLFANDDWVIAHSHPRCGMQYHLTPLSQLRLGGGHCYSRAAAAAGIINEINIAATEKKHRAWPTLVLGHVITSIERGDDYVLIDPSFGHFFYNSANSALASSRELSENPGLIKRVVQGGNRIINYIRPDAHVRLDEGTVVWPAGAPPK